MVDHIKDLKQDPENARLHNERNIGMIQQSLQEVGASRSIVIDEDDIIIAGNGVVDAAAQAGIEDVKVVEVDGETIVAVRRRGLTAEQKKRLAYFDNRTTELSAWDAGQIFDDVQADFDFDGIFTDAELAIMLRDFPEEDEDDGGRVSGGKEVTCPKCGHEFTT